MPQTSCQTFIYLIYSILNYVSLQMCSITDTDCPVSEHKGSGWATARDRPYNHVTPSGLGARKGTPLQLPATSYQLPATDYKLPTTSYQLPATSYRLPAKNFFWGCKKIAIQKKHVSLPNYYH